MFSDVTTEAGTFCRPVARSWLAVGLVLTVIACGCSESSSPSSTGDVTAPVAVNDLECVDPTPDAITVTWTAPADGADRGDVTAYDVRMFGSTITSANWDSATVCTGAAVPGEPGAVESLTVWCLDRGETYHFALRSADADSNWSDLSNDATGMTPAGAEVVDQEQPDDDYGFGLSDVSIKWQEFRAGLGNLTAVELRIVRSGSPGNLLVDITDTLDVALASVIVPEAAIALGSSWVRADFAEVVCVAPGEKYRIRVASDQPSPAPADRYAWRGDIDSSYDSGCLTDVSTGWTTYDYTFRTYGYSD